MYYFSKSLIMSLEDAVAATRGVLNRNGFIVLAEIDMREALKRHVAVDFRPYLILSACNQQLTHRAIRVDDRIGSIICSNIVIQQHDQGRVELSVADPLASMGTINHVELIWVTRDIRSALQRVLDGVECWAQTTMHPARAQAQLGHAA